MIMGGSLIDDREEARPRRSRADWFRLMCSDRESWELGIDSPGIADIDREVLILNPA
jgi:hypothetical protein